MNCKDCEDYDGCNPIYEDVGCRDYTPIKELKMKKWKIDYQWIYDNIKGYGQRKDNHCPGVRSWAYYKDWVNKGPLIDMGSGSGDTCTFFREKKIDSYGIDLIKPQFDYCKQGDITRSMDLKKYNTVTSFDVIEHLDNSQTTGLFQNMMQCENQIFTIANTPSYIIKDGKQVDLHINKKSWEIWRGILSDHFDIYQEIEIRDYQHLYLCKRKNGDAALIEYLTQKGYKITREES